MESESVRPLVVFDYDWSLINENSDTWVVQRLAPECYDEAFGRGGSALGWTERMDRAMGLLQDGGKTVAEVRSAAASVPFYPEMKEALAYAGEMGCRLIILSDANRIFIEEGLKAMGLDHLFDLDVAQEKRLYSEARQGVILTNEGFEENGRLRVAPFHDNKDCPLCPTNLCKGRVLSDALATRPARSSPILYIGDGGGDFCAAARLEEGDVLLYREGRKWGLQRRLERQGCLPGPENGQKALEVQYPIKAGLRPWRNGADVLRAFEDILSR
mmetsp:Transcript_83690/g.240538  ORF Transcript_83690/g.240538 Transcript_83690/m.240538 type:complete len:272 (+) Transcript_83690:1-816(+)